MFQQAETATRRLSRSPDDSGGPLGTGASAIQFVPRIREVAAHVTVYQRSAPWVVPKPDRAYTDAHRAAWMAGKGCVVQAKFLLARLH